MILDTSFFIDLDNSDQAAIRKARQIQQAGVVRRVPRVVVTELWVSAGMGSAPQQNRRTYRQRLAGYPRTDYTDSIAKLAGEIDGEARTNDPNDSGVGLADAVVAATAIEYDEPVVTDNTSDFVNRIQQNLGYSSLDVETY